MIEQERDDLPIRTIFIIFFVGTAVVVGCVVWLDAYIGARRDALERPAPTAGPVAPRELARVQQTLIMEAARGLEMREEARRALGEARWVDEESGVAEIPIDLAMRVVAERNGAKR